jgi:hypothetical protein
MIEQGTWSGQTTLRLAVRELTVLLESARM